MLQSKDDDGVCRVRDANRRLAAVSIYDFQLIVSRCVTRFLAVFVTVLHGCICICMVTALRVGITSSF